MLSRHFRYKPSQSGHSPCQLPRGGSFSANFPYCAAITERVLPEANLFALIIQCCYPGFAFDNALNTAILGKKGRSVDAVRALLDLDALKGSKDRTTDINKALEDAVKANPWAFGDTQPAGYPNVKDGGTPNHIPSQPDGVLAAFSKLNPNLKI